jgi:hypothetical protein
MLNCAICNLICLVNLHGTSITLISPTRKSIIEVPQNMSGAAKSVLAEISIVCFPVRPAKLVFLLLFLCHNFFARSL